MAERVTLYSVDTDATLDEATLTFVRLLRGNEAHGHLRQRWCMSRLKIACWALELDWFTISTILARNHWFKSPVELCGEKNINMAISSVDRGARAAPLGSHHMAHRGSGQPERRVLTFACSRGAFGWRFRCHFSLRINQHNHDHLAMVVRLTHYDEMKLGS